MKPNKLELQSSEQRNVCCRAKQGEWVACAQNAPNSLKGFSKAFNNFFLNWRIIVLQLSFMLVVHVGFCHITTWTSHKYTCASSLLNLPPTPDSIPALQVVTEPWAELPILYSVFPLAIYFMCGNMYVSVLLSQFIPPTPPPAVSRSLFSVSASLFLPWKYVHQYHFSRFHRYQQSIFKSQE